MSGTRPTAKQTQPKHYQHNLQHELDDWSNSGNRLPRPSLSRNVSEITHGGDSSDSGVCGGEGGGGLGDAMIAVIADSTTAASSEEVISNSSPTNCPRKASSSIDIQPYQVLPYDSRKTNPNPPSSTATGATNATTSVSEGESGSDAGCGGGCDGDSGIVGRVKRRDFSPTVVKNTVTTGAYR